MIYTVDSPIAHKIVIANDKGHKLQGVLSFDTETRKATMYKRDVHGKVEYAEDGKTPLLVEQVLDEQWYVCTREYYKMKFNFFELYKQDEAVRQAFHDKVREDLQKYGVTVDKHMMNIATPVFIQHLQNELK